MFEQNKILIFGNGQIGNKYLKYFKEKGYSVELSSTDITDYPALEVALDAFNPEIVINTAAKTNLEYTDENKLETFNVNALAAYELAKMCAARDIYFVHFSSGCIFESTSESDAKTETDVPNPSSYYAFTKAWGDELITKYIKDLKYLILRPRQPISGEVHYKNMLMKLLTFTKFVDTANTLTYIEDLLSWTEKLIEKRYVGIVNVANVGFTTPAKLAELLKKHVLPELEINVITKEELDKITPVRRVDTVLDVSLLESLVGYVRDCDEAAEEAIMELKENFEKEAAFTVNDNLRKTIEQTKARTEPNNVWQNLKK